MRLGEVEVPVPDDQVTGTSLTVTVPGGVVAGVQRVQVLHPRLVGIPPAERGGAESAAEAVIVRPTVAGAVTAVADGADAVAVTVPLTPAVGRRQRVMLILNEHHPADQRPGQSYIFLVPPRDPNGPAVRSDGDGPGDRGRARRLPGPRPGRRCGERPCRGGRRPLRPAQGDDPVTGPDGWPDPAWVEANHQFLTAALEAIRHRVSGADATAAAQRCEELARAMSTPPAVDGVAAAFGLSGFERDVLLLCAGVELETAVARACATAHGDPARPYATFSLAMGTLPDSHWSATTPAAPLRRWHLVELSHPELPTASPLRIDERMLHALTGIAYLDPRIEVLAEPLPPSPPLSAPLRTAADRLVASWSTPDIRRVRLSGRQPSDLRAVVSTASADLDLQPVCLRAADLPATPAERDLLTRLCERETVLSGRSWLVDIGDDGDVTGRSAIQLAVRLQAPVAVISRIPLDAEPLTAVEVPPADAHERRTAWRSALGPAPGLNGWVDRVAGQFDLGLAGIAAAAAEVRSELDREDAGPRLWDACRRQARGDLDDLTQRIEPRAGWDDLVLPASQLGLLREIAVHVRHRLTVFDDWGFGGSDHPWVWCRRALRRAERHGQDLRG